jgi:hypothetical protein
MGFLPYVLVKVAEVMKRGVLEVADAATENTRQLFALPTLLSRPDKPGTGSLVSQHILRDLLSRAADLTKLEADEGEASEGDAV